MPLPPASFHALSELAARWQATPFEIVTWAIEGRLALSVILPPVKTNVGNASGIADVEPALLLPLARKDSPGIASIRIRAIRRKGCAVETIVEPQEGAQIGAADVVIRRAEAERFERKHGLRKNAGSVARPRHDWDAFYGALARRVHDHGIPRTQAELARDMLDWFDRHSGCAVPDERTVRRRVSAVWRELSAADGF